MADQPGQGGLHARLYLLPFEHLPKILAGKIRVINIPESGYIRAAQTSLETQSFELMVIDGSFAPVPAGGQIPRAPIEVVDVEPPAPQRRGKRK